jgi:hypothetical protein
MMAYLSAVALVRDKGIRESLKGSAEVRHCVEVCWGVLGVRLVTAYAAAVCSAGLEACRQELWLEVAACDVAGDENLKWCSFEEASAPSLQK